MSKLILNEGAEASTPSSGKVVLYAKTDGKLYFKDDAGTETEVGGGGGIGDMLKSVYDTDDDGKVNSAVVADSANAVTWDNVSSKPSTFAPSAHKTNHQSGGSDSIKLDDLAAPDDNTDLNASTSKHGLLLKLDNNTSHFLRGDGTWNTPAGGSGASYASILALGGI